MSNTGGGNIGGQQQSGPSYTYDNQYKTDQGFKNRTSYGGIEGGADQAVNRYRQMGADQANRGAYDANYGDYQYGQGQARSAMDLQAQAAQGNAPSAAVIAGKAAADQQLQNQVAAAGSVRGGPAQQAAAYRANATQAAGQGANLAAGVQAGRAGETAQARGQYGQTALAYGGQALSQTGQDIQNQQFQRGLDQQGQQFNESLANNVDDTQLQANLAANGQANAMGQANIQNSQQSSDFGFGKGMQILGSVGKGAASGAGAALGAAARGGSVEYGKPYLVGEEGPELVIPKSDGAATVIPAKATASLLSRPEPRAMGGNIAGMGATSMTDPGGEGAGELGMGGAGGLVSGTIGHENQLVGGAVRNQTGSRFSLSDKRAKEEAHQRGYERGHADGRASYAEEPVSRAPVETQSRAPEGYTPEQEAADIVDQNRAAGHYASDPALYEPSTTPAQRDRASLNAAMAEGTSDATPYARGTPKKYDDTEYAEPGKGGVKNVLGAFLGGFGGQGAPVAAAQPEGRPYRFEPNRYNPDLYTPRAGGGEMDLGRWADEEIARTNAKKEASLSTGPAVRAESRAPSSKEQRQLDEADRMIAAANTQRDAQLSRGPAVGGERADLGAWADREIAATNAQRDAQLARGPAVGSAAPSWLDQYMAGQRENGGDMQYTRTSHLDRKLPPPPAEHYPQGRGGLPLAGEKGNAMEHFAYSDARAKDEAHAEGVKLGEARAAQRLQDMEANKRSAPPPEVHRDPFHNPRYRGPEVEPDASAPAQPQGHVPPPPPPPRRMGTRPGPTYGQRLRQTYDANTGPAPLQFPASATTSRATLADPGVRGKDASSAWQRDEGDIDAPPGNASRSVPWEQPPADVTPRAEGGDLSPLLKEDANRKMKASPYSYKSGFRPDEQEEGEMNYGPMAQDLEKNPLTASTVKKDGAGMRMVDMHKLTKVHSGAIAHLQEQIDALRGRSHAR